MKKLLIITTIASLILFSCNKDEISNDSLIDTSWSANDLSGESLWGGTHVITIEFLNDITCQEITTIKGAKFNNGTTVVKGTWEYSYNVHTINWTIKDRTTNGTISGSTLTTNRWQPGGGKMIFIKNQ